MKKLLLLLSTISSLALADDIPLCSGDAAPTTYINVGENLQSINFRDGYGVGFNHNRDNLFFYKDGVLVKTISVPNKIASAVVGIDPKGNHVVYMIYVGSNDDSVTDKIYKYNFEANSNTYIKVLDSLINIGGARSLAFDGNTLVWGGSGYYANSPAGIGYWRNEKHMFDDYITWQNPDSGNNENDFIKLALDGGDLYQVKYLKYGVSLRVADRYIGVSVNDISPWFTNDSLVINSADFLTKGVFQKHLVNDRIPDSLTDKFDLSVNKDHHLVAADTNGDVWFYPNRDAEPTKLNQGKDWHTYAVSLQNDNTLYFTSDTAILQCKAVAE